jgi:hypothetical protein
MVVARVEVPIVFPLEGSKGETAVGAATKLGRILSRLLRLGPMKWALPSIIIKGR